MLLVGVKRFGRVCSSASAILSRPLLSVSSPPHPPPANTSITPSASFEIFIFIGAPGVGKGTFASLATSALSLYHLDMGTLLRNEIKSSSEFGVSLKRYVSIGELVPDELVNHLVTHSIKSVCNNVGNHYSSNNDRRLYKGILLDGYPRNLQQAQYLDGALSTILPDVKIKAVNISLEKWVAIEKCLGRRVCKTCGKGFNTAHIVEKGFDMPSINPDPLTCKNKPECKPLLEKRDDDTIDVLTRRFESFNESTKPLLDYYSEKSCLKSFEVRRGIKDTNLLINLLQESP